MKETQIEVDTRRRFPIRAHFVAPIRVLLAEDDERMRSLLAAALRRNGFEVIEARDGARLLESIDRCMMHGCDGRSIDLVISDQRMPGCTGLEALAGLRLVDWYTPFILITAFGDDHTHGEARRLGAATVFDKPFAVDDLCTAALYYARKE